MLRGTQLGARKGVGGQGSSAGRGLGRGRGVFQLIFTPQLSHEIQAHTYVYLFCVYLFVVDLCTVAADQSPSAPAVMVIVKVAVMAKSTVMLLVMVMLMEPQRGKCWVFSKLVEACQSCCAVFGKCTPFYSIVHRLVSLHEAFMACLYSD